MILAKGIALELKKPVPAESFTTFHLAAVFNCASVGETIGVLG
jgi:hypothetical protein